MKKNLSILFLFLFNGVVYAQEGISSGGNTISESTASIDYSIGQVAVESFSNDTQLITPGVIQPSIQIVNLIDTDLAIKIKVFPVPTSSAIQIEAGYEFSKIILYNSMGKELAQFPSATNSISLSSYSEKLFILHVYSKNQIIKSFKVIKQ